MRRLCRSVTEMALLAALACGCGSTPEDSLVLRFMRFDNTGLTQSDAVRQTSADVDVILDRCPDGSFEPVTETTINAVFRNEEGSDIRLDGYRIHVPNKDSGLGDIDARISAVIQGGRCPTEDRPCAVDDDCRLFGGGCVHSETTVSSLLLFDFVAKAAVLPRIYGEATNIEITFFGSDPNQSFAVSAGYVVTFADFNNCASSGGGAG